MPAKKIQKHDFPAFVSFLLPGIGQLVKGHVIKGILIALVNVGLWSIPIVFVRHLVISFLQALAGLRASLADLPNHLDIGFLAFLIWALVLFAFWVWNIYDAYNAN